MDIIRPDIVAAREKAEAEAHQLERRRIALALLPTIIETGCYGEAHDVSKALAYADDLIAKTTVK